MKMRPALAILPIPPALLKRIRDAEVVIMEEAMQQMMVSEQENSTPNKDVSSVEQHKDISCAVHEPQRNSGEDRKSGSGELDDHEYRKSPSEHHADPEEDEKAKMAPEAAPEEKDEEEKEEKQEERQEKEKEEEKKEERKEEENKKADWQPEIVVPGSGPKKEKAAAGTEPNPEAVVAGFTEKMRAKALEPEKSAKKDPAQWQPEISADSMKPKQPLAGLCPLGIREGEVAAFLQEYQRHVSDKLVQSYVPCAELLEKSMTGYEPCWVCLKDFSVGAGKSPYENVKGLAVFHVDPTSKLRVRVNILHASVAESAGPVKEFLQKVVDYVWANVNCEEIRVGLAHIEQAGEKYVPYEPLKNAYQELQFRWKTLTNDEEGKRILVLGLSRPATKPFANPR